MKKLIIICAALIMVSACKKEEMSDLEKAEQVVAERLTITKTDNATLIIQNNDERNVRISTLTAIDDNSNKEFLFYAKYDTIEGNSSNEYVFPFAAGRELKSLELQMANDGQYPDVKYDIIIYKKSF